MTEALRACPFACKHSLPQLRNFYGTWWVRCAWCDCVGPEKETEAEACAAWNRRTPVALPSREEVAEVIRSGRAYEATSDQIADAILNQMRERMG